MLLISFLCFSYIDSMHLWYIIASIVIFPNVLIQLHLTAIIVYAVICKSEIIMLNVLDLTKIHALCINKQIVKWWVSVYVSIRMFASNSNRW